MDNNYQPLALYRRLLSYSMRYWQLFFVSLLALTVAAGTEPLFARFIKPLIDDNFNPDRAEAARALLFLHVRL